jgi:hypothetical protein
MVHRVHHLLAFDAETRAWRGGIAIVGAVVTVVLWRGSGVGVMWCGSRARGVDRLMKLALDPASEARRFIFLRKAGCFTRCTRTAGPNHYGKDGVYY